MDPVTLGLLGGGLVLRAFGQYQESQAQAEAATQNASFYREQAAFAQKTGERQQGIFDRESQVLFGEQVSAFAKAGVDTQSSSLFLAKSILARTNESYAIKAEADLNVRLATLRAEHAQSEAERLSSPTNQIIGILGPALQTAGTIYAGRNK